jgi:hypothetical protein
MSTLRKFVTISFLESYDLSGRSIKFANGLVGLYFIFLEGVAVPYPFAQSRLIYIGLSESAQNSIGSRLRGHLTGQSGNLAISNYASQHSVRFSYHSLDVLSVSGTKDLYELESYFLSDFLRRFGSFPICNGQAGMTIVEPSLDETRIDIDWKAFAPWE